MVELSRLCCAGSADCRVDPYIFPENGADGQGWHTSLFKINSFGGKDLLRIIDADTYSALTVLYGAS
jgi:hypothetical protein